MKSPLQFNFFFFHSVKQSLVMELFICGLEVIYISVSEKACHPLETRKSPTEVCLLPGA